MYLKEEKSFPDVSQAAAQSTRERLQLQLREQDTSLLCLTPWNKAIYRSIKPDEKGLNK